jgi:hypothetical protein
MGSLKTSDFASKLEAVLQEKLYDVKCNERRKKPQLFTKNFANTESFANTEKPKHNWTVITMNSNKQQNEEAENKNDLVEQNEVIQNQADEQLADREMDRANIRGKLERFFANRSDPSVLLRQLSHPNLVSLPSKGSEMKYESDGVFPKKPLVNETVNLKVNNESTNFDVVRKQRLLMGEVLASLKFIATKNMSASTADSELASTSDASEDDVFEDITQLSKVPINVGQ